MTSFRARLAARRQRLVAHSAVLRGELVGDLSGLRRRIDGGARILSLLPLVKPLISFWWRRRGR